MKKKPSTVLIRNHINQSFSNLFAQFEMAAIIRFVTLALIATFLISEVELLIQADNALKGQLPYMASIAFRGKRSYCGGAIINSRYVISSGHMLFRLQTRDLIVYLGAWKYSDLDAVPASIAKAVIHPEFNVRRRLNDIALVRMANEIKFTNLVQPIALPDMDFSDVHGETFLVSGFGLTEVSSTMFFLFFQIDGFIETLLETT